MSHYELTYILSAAIPETDCPAMQKKIAETIVSLGQGTVTLETVLGRKKLAYPINKEKYGHYVTVEFDAEPTSIKALDQELKLNNACIRHLIISKQLLTPEQQEREASRQAKVRARKAAAKMSTVVVEKEVKKTEKSKPKISLDKLDEKLDELLGQELK